MGAPAKGRIALRRMGHRDDLTPLEFPPRQKPGSFSLGDAMDKIIQGSGGRN
jgi:hypothetical protein